MLVRFNSAVIVALILILPAVPVASQASVPPCCGLDCHWPVIEQSSHQQIDSALYHEIGSNLIFGNSLADIPENIATVAEIERNEAADFSLPAADQSAGDVKKAQQAAGESESEDESEEKTSAAGQTGVQCDVIPEPSTIALVGVGLLVLIRWKRPEQRKKRVAAD